MHHHNQPFLDTLEADRLLRAASRGDAGAWSALMARFTARLVAVARRHRLTTHDAEDIVQTTWLRLLEHADSVRDPAAVGAWLETTARRESLRVLGAARREPPADPEQLTTEPVWDDTEPDLMTDETRAAIRRVLDELPSRQRQLLVMLFADEEPSYEEIGRMLDMPIGSIGPTRARGLERLRCDRTVRAAVGATLE